MDTNVIGNNTTGITAATDMFLVFYGAGAGATATISVITQSVMTIAGSIKNFYIQCDAGPGAGLSRTFTINKNGVDTGVALTLTGAGTGAGVSTGNDTSNTASFVAGDLISIHTTATGTTTSTGTIRWCADVLAAANTSIVMGNTGTNMNTTLTNYVVVQGKGIDTTLASNSYCVMPTNGVLKNAYATTSNSPGTGKSYTATLFQNGSSTSIVVTFTDGNQTANDTTHTVSVSSGDVLYWAIVPAGTPTAASCSISMEFDPTINGESIHGYGSSVVDVATATRFNAVTSPGAASYQSAEAARQTLTLAAVWQKLYVNLLTAPGLTTSFQTQLSIATVAGSPSVTISGTSTTGNDSGTATSTAGQTVIMKMTPTNTPITSTLSWGVVSFIAPATTGSGGSTLLMMGVG